MTTPSSGRPRVTAGPLTPRAQVQVYAGQFGPTGPPGPPNTLTAGPTTTGAPGSNASVVITGTAPNQTVAFTIPRGDVGPQGDPTAFELRGTGSPQNSVAAPVGSYYTDTAATNGAIRWIKQTGTGSAGWRVLWGDTGWRTLPWLNGWTGAANGIQIRRLGDLVSFRMQALSAAAATSDTFADLAPTGYIGWRPSVNIQLRRHAAMFGMASGDLNAARMVLWDLTAAGAFVITRASMPSTTPTITDMFFWQTTDAWPATLP